MKAAQETNSPAEELRDRPSIYSSPSITERRRRILREVRQLLAERGIEGVAIRELCKRADVAQRTFYNAFRSKDRVIAIAIREAYEEINDRIRYRTSPDTLEGYLDRLTSVHQRNFRSRNYTEAVTSLFFSSEVTQDIFNALQAMGTLNLRIWLKTVEDRNELAECVHLGELEQNLINLQFATTHDWSRRRIEDKDYIRRLCEGCLIIAAGSTTGASRDQAAAILSELRRTGTTPNFPNPVFVHPEIETIA